MVGGDYEVSLTNRAHNDQNIWVPYTPHFCRVIDRMKVGEKVDVPGTGGLWYVAKETAESGKQYSTAAPDARQRAVARCGERKLMQAPDCIAWHAAQEGDAELLTFALTLNVDPAMRGPTYDLGGLLHAACSSGRLTQSVIEK